MQNLGDYRIDDYITFGVQLHRFSSGAVYAPTGNVTYTFYENNSTSGAPTGGNLAQLNSKTGLYTARVQLTTASGFEVGKEYLIHVEATVDSVAAAELFLFRTIANPKVDVDTIKTQTVTCAGGVTIPAATLASTTNITAATGITVSTNNDKTGYTASTVSDKTGYALADATSDAVIADAVWNALTASYGSANTYGALVETNLDTTISSRLAPAGTLALVTNLTNLPSIPANWITAAGINAGAITNAKFAAGAIDANAIATGAIDADAIAADAIGSSEFAQAAADKVWATAARTLTAATNITSTGGTTVPQTGDSFARIGANGASLTSVGLAASQSGVTIGTVTNLTNAPTNGDLTATMKASVNTEIDTALADINLDHLVGTATGIPAVPAGTFLDQIMDDGTATFDRTTDSLQAIRDGASAPSAATIADAVWDEVLDTAHEVGGSSSVLLQAAGTAADPWLTTLPGSYGSGTAGKIIGDNLNATVSSRATQTSVDTIDSIVDNIHDTDLPAVKSDTAAILQDTATDGVVVASGSKTGYALADASSDAVIADAVWNAATSGYGGAGSYGNLVETNLDTTVSSRLAPAGTLATVTTATNLTNLPSIPANWITNAGIANDAISDAKVASDVTIASVTGSVGSVAGNVTGSVGSLATQAKADVNAEVLDVLTVDTFAEPTSVPAATSTIKDKLNWLFALGRNKKTQTATTATLRNDGDAGNIGTSTVSDDSTTFTSTKWS